MFDRRKRQLSRCIAENMYVLVRIAPGIPAEPVCPVRIRAEQSRLRVKHYSLAATDWSAGRSNCHSRTQRPGLDAKFVLKQARHHPSDRNASEAEPVRVFSQRILCASGIEKWLIILDQV